MEKVKTAAQ
jgi:hypothetical protein